MFVTGIVQLEIPARRKEQQTTAANTVGKRIFAENFLVTIFA